VSYVQPQQRRPGTVTVAGFLLILVAVLVVAGGVITIATLGSYTEAVKRAYAAAGAANGSQIADQMSGVVYAGAIIGLIVNLLFAAGFVVLAMLNNRGKNPARIVTWVLAGLGVLCFGCSAASSASGGFTSGMFSGSTSNGVSPAEITRQIQDAIPSWLIPVQTAITVINLLALITVIILLAMPASNAFFRPAEPSMLDPGYPAYPGYPPAGNPPPPPYGSQPPYGQPPYGDQPPTSGPPSV
jgi:hypothetical protein